MSQIGRRLDIDERIQPSHTLRQGNDYSVPHPDGALLI